MTGHASAAEVTMPNPPYDDEWDEHWDGTGSISRTDPYDDDEWVQAWAYATEERRVQRRAHWDAETQRWTCSCKQFIEKKNCYHVYNFRHEVVVKVNEEYL
jgi:hypothetical protein